MMVTVGVGEGGQWDDGDQLSLVISRSKFVGVQIREMRIETGEDGGLRH